MPNYILKDNQIHFRQGFSRPVLVGLFTTLHTLQIDVRDTGSRVYPYAVGIGESEFQSILELAEEL